MENFDPNTQIAVIWSVEDVKSIRSELDDEQAMRVLWYCKEFHDAEIGINWDVISTAAEDLYPKEW